MRFGEISDMLITRRLFIDYLRVFRWVFLINLWCGYNFYIYFEVELIEVSRVIVEWWSRVIVRLFLGFV